MCEAYAGAQESQNGSHTYRLTRCTSHIYVLQPEDGGKCIRRRQLVSSPPPSLAFPSLLPSCLENSVKMLGGPKSEKLIGSANVYPAQWHGLTRALKQDTSYLTFFFFFFFLFGTRPERGEKELDIREISERLKVDNIHWSRAVLGENLAPVTKWLNRNPIRPP